MTLSGFQLDRLSIWALAIGPFAHVAVGFALGVLYFCGLWWNARLFAADGRATTFAAFGIGRFAILAAVLTLASLEGALPLLLTGLGVLLARPIVMRRVGVAR